MPLLCNFSLRSMHVLGAVDGNICHETQLPVEVTIILTIKLNPPEMQLVRVLKTRA